MTDQQQNSASGKKEHNHFNPVSIKVIDTIGAIALGILAFILLIALLRAQAHNRKLIAQLSQ